VKGDAWAGGRSWRRRLLACPVRNEPRQHEAVVRLPAADIVGEPPVLDSLRALRAEIADIAARLDAAEAVACTIPSRDYYLLVNRRLARRIVQVHTDWLNEVEQELGSRSRR
jgi:(2Fe-2S) ferredoxin